MRKNHSWLKRVLLTVNGVLIIMVHNVSIAADNSGSEAVYQSVFEDYKSDSTQGVSNWTKNTTPSNSHTGHDMQKMQTESVISPVITEFKSPMQLNHMLHQHDSNMQGMDMKPMNHSEMMDMDHSRMARMEHNNDPSEAHVESNHRIHTHKEHINDVGSPSSMNDDSMHTHEHHLMPSANSDTISEADKSIDLHHHQESEGNDSSEAHSKATNPAHSYKSKIIPNVHPAIVHFPIALTFMSLLFGIAAAFKRQTQLGEYFTAYTHFTLWLSAFFGLIAVLFGWLAFNSVNHDEGGHLAMLTHRSWAIPTVAGLIGFAVWDIIKNGYKRAISISTITLLFVLSLGIGITAWLGGEVVYRHGIGVLSLPASGGHNHAGHHHGEASESAIPAQGNHSGHQHESSSEGDSHEH